MAEEFTTKIEFLLEVFPTLSKQTIISRLNSAPSSERSTDALVAYFLAEEEKKVGETNESSINTSVHEENDAHIEIAHEEANQNISDNSHFQENAPAHEEGDGQNEDKGITNNSSSSRQSKYIIQDDDLDESMEVSPDPVEYSALTGRIEKTVEQLAQEEDDLKLAQKLYEEELTLKYLQQENQNQSQQPYQSTYISPYDKLPPKLTETKTTTTNTKTTTTTTTTHTNAVPPNKRQAVGLDSETKKKSSNDIADQLAEIRKQRESQWRATGRKPQASTGNNQGFNAGYYNQLKEVRNKHNREWHDTKVSQKRVWTIGDMENATKQGHIDSGKFGAGDSAAIRIGKEALELTNKFRKENKLPPLVWHAALCTIGAQHSKNMAEHKVAFGHDGFQERIRQYPMAHRSAAENVAMSRGLSDVAQTAVNGWINSPGHRKNLVSRSEYCGIGCYEGADGSWYLTQLFAG